MLARCCVRGLLFLCLGSTLVGCSNQGLDSLQVTPASQSLTVGQTVQFTATGIFGNANHPATQNITSVVNWSSSTPSVATVSASGLAAAVGAGTTTITATATGFAGPVSSSATLTVTASGGGVAGGSIASISIIPGAQSVSSPTQTSQFLAIGTTSSGATVNLTGQVAWSSSTTQIATIGAATGLATAVGQGTATITALYTNSAGGTVVTGTATFTVAGGTAEKFTAVTIIPNSQSLSTLGETGQFIALGTSGSTGLQTDVTNSTQIKWSSSAPTVASVSASGFATDLAAGATTITAELTNADGTVVSNTASLAASLTAAPQDLLSVTIIPSSITVGNLGLTGQFLAIGTFSTPPTIRDLTNSVNWISSGPNVFPVTTNNSAAPGKENGGVASAFGNGSATIIAEATGTDGSIQTATATFACPLVEPTTTNPGSCFPGSQAPALLSTLTVYNEGLNTTNWEVTAPSATGTPNVLHCGPGWSLNGGAGGSVCTATYPVGTTVTLTAPANAGAFGGWSSNCSQGPVTAAGANTCTVALTSDDTVGAIFN
jgi:uncharacterized protein YjdB